MMMMIVICVMSVWEKKEIKTDLIFSRIYGFSLYSMVEVAVSVSLYVETFHSIIKI